jgi:hypothetical protein
VTELISGADGSVATVTVGSAASAFTFFPEGEELTANVEVSPVEGAVASA